MANLFLANIFLTCLGGFIFLLSKNQEKGQEGLISLFTKVASF